MQLLYYPSIGKNVYIPLEIKYCHPTDISVKEFLDFEASKEESEIDKYVYTSSTEVFSMNFNATIFE